MESSERPLFREAQYFRQVWWVMFLVLGVAALMWWGLIQQIFLGRPWGTNPAPDWAMWLFWLLFGIGLPLLFCTMGLIIEVYSSSVLIHYFPLSRRSISMDDIESLDSRTYAPIRQFGGWGIRGAAHRRAYTIKGNQGVEITMKNGQSILIGSQNPQELALAIESRR